VARLGSRHRGPVDHRDERARAADDGSRGARRPQPTAIAVASVVAGALFVVFLLLPWGNASFLLAIITLLV